jgi:hypothetical protein
LKIKNKIKKAGSVTIVYQLSWLKKQPILLKNFPLVPVDYKLKAVKVLQTLTAFNTEKPWIALMPLLPTAFDDIPIVLKVSRHMHGAANASFLY